MLNQYQNQERQWMIEYHLEINKNYIFYQKKKQNKKSMMRQKNRKNEQIQMMMIYQFIWNQNLNSFPIFKFFCKIIKIKKTKQKKTKEPQKSQSYLVNKTNENIKNF